MSPTLTLLEMRQEATMQLMAYRVNRVLLREIDAGGRTERVSKRTGRVTPAPTLDEVRALRAWRRAIESVRAILHESEPLKERFMVRYFALETAHNRRQSQRARHMELMAQLNISDSTIYKWKEGVLQLVIAAAIEAGLLRPFGFGCAEPIREE